MKKGSAFVLILLLCSIWLPILDVRTVKAEAKTIVVPENPNLEHELFTVVRYFLFKKYFENVGTSMCQEFYRGNRANRHCLGYPELKPLMG